MNYQTIEDIYPLTPMQQGMLFHSLYAPGSGVYITQSTGTLEGDLDVAAFTQAWQQVMARHAILRTAFIWEDLEEPVQVVCREVSVPLTCLDWRALPKAEQETELKRFLADDHRQDFDLAQAPLMRLTLIQMGDQRHQFVWSHHHILLDGWSLPLLMGEIFACYGAFHSGHTLTLPPSPPFRDYIAWLQQQDGAQAEAFWRRTLSGWQGPTSPRQHLHQRDLTMQPNEYAEQGLSLSRAATEALEQVAQRHQLTMNTLVQGAWALLLSHYADAAEIIFGAVVAGRPADLPGVETMVGLFINTLPVRVQLSPVQSLLAWLQQLQAQQVAMRNYEYCPLSQIQSWAEAREPSGRGQALFEALYAFENYPRQTPTGGVGNGQSAINLQIRNYRTVEQNNHPLGLMSGTASQLPLKMIYDRSVYSDATVAQMLAHLQGLLERFPANMAQPLSALSLLTDTERQLLVEWNQTALPVARTQCIHERFAAQAAQSSTAVAVVYEEQQLTFGELNQRANQLAHYLQKLGVGPDVCVGLCMERSLEMVVGLLGILKAGGAYVPLEPTHPAQRLAFILQDTQAPVLLTQHHLLTALPPFAGEVVCLDAAYEADTPHNWAKIAQESTENPCGQVTAQNLAYVIYTSGSTGTPKGVLVQHDAVINLLAGLAQAIYHQASQSGRLRVSLNGPLIFDTSVKQLIQLLHGHTLCIIPHHLRFDGAALLAHLQRQAIDLFDCTPSQLRLLLAAGLLTAPAAPAHILLGGEAIDEALWQTLAQAEQINFYNLYGPTECTVDATCCKIERACPTPVIGRPLPNVQTYILNRYGQPAPVGVAGELYIGGAGVARGYLNHPELTAAKFLPDPWGATGARFYQTGDRARYLADGRIEFLGRVDDQVKVRGFRVEPSEIATTLEQHPHVQRAVVLARESAIGSKQLAAYVVPTPARAPMVAGRPRYRLPNGLAIVHLNQNETDFLYEEMFAVRAYEKHGITINDGACILDVGANIGLFTLAAHLRARNVKIFAFEPNPTVFELLRTNVALYGVDATVFPCGLSSAAAKTEFTFYRQFSILSGLYADVEAEKEVVRSYIRSHQNGDITQHTQNGEALLDAMLTEKLRRETLEVELKTISAIVQEHALDRIDLLKINVEKSEYDVLAGIADADWPKIRQVALEVHDINGQLERVTTLLRQQGFAVAVEQDWSLEETTTSNYYIYATHDLRQEERAPVQTETTEENPRLQAAAPLTEEELRGYLLERLPDYMVPAAFVFVESIPLTTNGKVDRRALTALAPDQAQRGLSQEFVAPRTAAEQTLAAIFQQVLKVESVGVHDSFFALGGDSLLSIQVVSHAGQAGLHLSPAQIFDHPTVAALAQLAQEQRAITAEQGEVTGTAPLTPIQAWFLEQRFPDPHHWNWSYFYETIEPLDPLLLEQTVLQLMQHHDILRLRLHLAEAERYQIYDPATAPPPFTRLDLSAVTDAALPQAITDVATAVQTSLNLTAGPLLRVAYFDCGATRTGRLLIALHHLVVDAVSVRILSEDFWTVYQGLARHQVDPSAPATVPLPAKTTSYRAWSQRLWTYAQSEAVQQELTYWLETVGNYQPHPLPVDYADGDHTFAAQGQIILGLSRTETEALLQETLVAYDAQIDDLLFTALMRTLTRWSGQAEHLIDTESHGRHAEVVGKVDLARTVGWFTNSYPVLLRLDETLTPGAAVRTVQQQLRAIPQRGLGYGLLRYLCQEPWMRAQMAALPQAQVSFAYMGQFDRGFTEISAFRQAPESQGPTRNQNAHNPYQLYIVSEVHDRILYVNFRYGREQYKRRTMENLAESYLAELRLLIEQSATTVANSARRHKVEVIQ